MTGTAIEEAARNMGIVPGDPAYPFVRFMMGQADDLAQQQEGLLQRLDQVITEAKTIAGGEIAKSAARELPGAIRAATFKQHRVSFWVAAGVLITSIVVSGCLGILWELHEDANRYINVPAALGIALTGPEGAEWVNLIRLNDLRAVNRRCQQQTGGDACDFSFWTNRPPAK